MSIKNAVLASLSPRSRYRARRSRKTRWTKRLQHVKCEASTSQGHAVQRAPTKRLQGQNGLQGQA